MSDLTLLSDEERRLLRAGFNLANSIMVIASNFPPLFFMIKHHVPEEVTQWVDACEAVSGVPRNLIGVESKATEALNTLNKSIDKIEVILE